MVEVNFRPMAELKHMPDREILVLSKSGHWSVLDSQCMWGVVDGQIAQDGGGDYPESLYVRADQCVGWVELSELAVEVLAPPRRKAPT